MTTSEQEELFKRFIAAEYGYISPRGLPLCWPVTPYWVPERGVLAIATGVAYPRKADYAKLTPEVALYFSDPTGSGIPNAPSILVKGRATVLDQDLQENTDRYVRAIRQKFSSARLAVNNLTAKFLDFYLPRLWVEIEPTSIEDRPHGSLPPTSSRPPIGTGKTLNDQDRSRVDQLASRFDDAVLTVVDENGCPDMTRMAIAGSESGKILLERPGPSGDAVLALHQHSMGGTRFHAYMLRGSIDASRPNEFATERIVGFFGNGALFPLSVIPQIADKRRSLKRELRKRGQPMPKLRVPPD